MKVAAAALKSWVFYDECSGADIDPSQLWFEEADIRAYMAEHPFTEDENCRAEDIVSDFTHLRSAYIVDADVKPETIEYIVAMINALANKED